MTQRTIGTSGALLQSVRLDSGMRVTVAEHYRHATLRMHGHQCPSVAVVLGGALRERSRRFDEVFARGGVIIKHADEQHANVYGPSGAKTLLIELSDETTAVWGRFRQTNAETQRIVGRLASCLALSLNASRDVSEVGDRATEILALVGSEPSAVPRPWLLRARARLREEWKSPPDLCALARECAVHPSHFVRAFGLTFGVSPTEYVRNLRRRWAYEQIVSTCTPLSMIAAESGYADQSHLTREITRYYGNAPGSIRSFARGKEPEQSAYA